MNRNQSRWKMGSLMALLLFVIFAVCVMIVLLTGADVYKRLVERDQNSYDRRTAVSYLTTRVRQADRQEAVRAADFAGQSAVRVADFHGQDALVIAEDIDGSRYETWIYCYDGFIRELFAAADSGLPPEAGDKVLEAADLEFQWQDELLCADITTPDGVKQSIILHLRSGEEVGP